MSQEANSPSLLEFPCRFPVKAMGRQRDGFEPVRSTPSRAGRFVSVTAVIEARSQEQLDAIYQDLTDCVEVLMAL